jgi:hypothetical protein
MINIKEMKNIIKNEKVLIAKTRQIFEEGIESLLSKGKITAKEIELSERLFHQVMKDNEEYLDCDSIEYIKTNLKEQHPDTIDKIDEFINGTKTENK